MWRSAMVVVAAALMTLVLPGVAGATGFSDSVSMYSEGDWVGGGVQRIFHPGNSQIGVYGTPAYLTVSVSGGTYGDSYDFDFAAPPGQNLHPGVYTRAQRAPFREATRPGIDISGDGRGCNEDAGQFEVRDIGTDASGNVNRVWIVYEQLCEAVLRRSSARSGSASRPTRG